MKKLLFLLLLLLFSCYKVEYGTISSINVYNLGNGKIIDKSYTASYYTTETRQVYDPVLECHRQEWYEEYHPAKYEILLMGSDELTGISIITQWYAVNEGIYNKYQVDDELYINERLYAVYLYHYDTKDKLREGMRVINKDIAAMYKPGDFIDFRK